MATRPEVNTDYRWYICGRFDFICVVRKFNAIWKKYGVDSQGITKYSAECNKELASLKEANPKKAWLIRMLLSPFSRRFRR